MTMIVYVKVTNPERLKEVDSVNFSLLKETVDRRVLVINEVPGIEELSEQDWERLRTLSRRYDVEVYAREWDDDFPEMRNFYLCLAQHGDWLVVEDSDEYHCDNTFKEIRNLVATAEREGYNMLLVNAHDFFGEDFRKSDFFKGLIYRKEPGMRHVGVGNVPKVHETLVSPMVPVKACKLDPEHYWYDHFKSMDDIYERAARNVFIAGGGNNVGDVNHQWKVLRNICESLGITRWHQFREYLRKGNIDPRLKEWIIDNRRMGFDWQNEMADLFRYYFHVLHPEERPPGVDVIEEIEVGSDPWIYRKIEDAHVRVLGNHAPLDLKNRLFTMIKRNELSVDELEDYLRRLASVKFSHEVNDVVRVTVPVSLKIPKYQVERDLLTKYYRKEAAARITKQRIWEAYLAIAFKAETSGEGVDHQDEDHFDDVASFVESHAPPEKFQRLLDLGAGCGAEVAVLARRGYDVTGVTSGRGNVIHAEKEHGVALLEMDFHFLTFPPATFDAVVMVHSFEHAHAPHVLVGEIRHVLRPRGRVIIEVPPHDDPDQHTIWHVNLLTPEQITELFEYWGFKVIRHGSIDGRHVFEKLPDGHVDFKNWGYLQHVIKRRFYLT